MTLGISGIVGYYATIAEPSYEDAPTLDDSKILGFSSSSTTHNFATSGFTVDGKRILALIGNNGASATFVSFAGDGSPADTSASVVEYDTNPRFRVREVTVNDTLDTNWVLTVNIGARPVISTLAIGNLDTLLSYTPEAGVGSSAPTASLRAVTGGPHNLLVIQAVLISGAHVSNPPTVPSGYTIVDASTASLTNDPTGLAVTMCVAQKTYAVDDLTWVAGEADVPAVTWGGLGDMDGSNSWRTTTLIGINT